jgi:hypothetical protein
LNIFGKNIHECGTARMGDDPKTSVLNAYNQVHDVKNVFVTDGACFVTQGCSEPTLTIMAISARAARLHCGAIPQRSYDAYPAPLVDAIGRGVVLAGWAAPIWMQPLRRAFTKPRVNIWDMRSRVIRLPRAAGRNWSSFAVAFQPAFFAR